MKIDVLQRLNTNFKAEPEGVTYQKSHSCQFIKAMERRQDAEGTGTGDFRGKEGDTAPAGLSVATLR